MASVNKVLLIGRIGKQPEVKHTQDGRAVCNISVATSEEWKDKNTGEKKERTEWHRVTLFGRQADFCGQYLGKGSQVYIDGKLQTREYEDKNGVKRQTTEVMALDIKPLDSRRKEDADQEPDGNTRNPYESDIPF